ncbi:hypothetical protein BCV70DRAFT_68931 [Testicularia cyperi]|uniref:Peptidase S53 activation domain-containing protein n=1 Tax=Testicularia cyperi TaxID=1882483 RepID=A0A317XG02_9BASI|nr:hypothetical protein BCV70DRAFT_68931 [Testicularia cyperi]
MAGRGCLYRLVALGHFVLFCMLLQLYTAEAAPKPQLQLGEAAIETLEDANQLFDTPRIHDASEKMQEFQEKHNITELIHFRHHHPNQLQPVMSQAELESLLLERERVSRASAGTRIPTIPPWNIYSTANPHGHGLVFFRRRRKRSLS